MFIHYFLCYNGTVNKYPKGEPNCGKQFIFIHYFPCYNSTVKKHQAADAHLHPLLFCTLFSRKKVIAPMPTHGLQPHIAPRTPTNERSHSWKNY